MIDAEELPEGWAITKLGDIVKCSTERVEPGEQDNTPYLSLEHIESQTSRIIGQGFGSDVRSIKSVFRAGDVLYGKLRPYLNKVCRPDFAGMCSTDILVLRPTIAIDPGFLHRILTTPEVVQYAVDNSNGINLPRTSFHALSELSISLPPLAEQRRIVARIEALQARSRKAREALEAVPPLLEQFRQSVLAAAFRGDLTAAWREQHPDAELASALLDRIRQERRRQWEVKNPHKKYVEPEPVDDADLPELPEGWCWGSLNELSIVVRGASPRPAGSPAYFNGTHTPWITVGELTKDDNLYLTSTSAMLTAEGRERSRYIETGNLLLTNSGATLGVPKITRIGGCINDGSVALLGLDDLLQHYIYFYLTTQTKVLRAINQGAAQPNLNTELVKAIVVPIASVEECIALVQIVNSQLARTITIRALSERLMKDLNRLGESILSQAFRGKLVEQDPTDESASVLLARIRAGGVKPEATTSPLRVEEVVHDLLLLLEAVGKPMDRASLELGLVLMLNENARTAILDKTIRQPRRAATGRTFVQGLDFLFGTLANTKRWITVSAGVPQLISLTTNVPSLSGASDEDRRRVKETLKVLATVKKDRLAAAVEKVCDVAYELAFS